MNLFEPSEKPRVFAIPPGCDFPRELVEGLLERFKGQPPENLAKTEIFLNTQRSREVATNELVKRGPTFLPKIRLITSLSHDKRYPDIRGPVSPLRRRLELAQAVAKLLEGDQRFGARTAAYELADSLAALMDEMHGEGVKPESLRNLERELDMSNFSNHWQQSLAFINIIGQYWGTDAVPDIEARQRLVIERMCDEWRKCPPKTPVLVAGSTGSRGATHLLMQAVAMLPQGAVVLPCFDFDMPDEVWSEMKTEEHPQYRFKTLMSNLAIASGDIRKWREESICDDSRNRLVSLALRPAPVTDQWMDEGPKLENLVSATSTMSLMEAPNPRIEAVAIALRLRKALADGKTAALVTADRRLSRQVKAALGRWGIVPLDGSGDQLIQTVPGRLLRQVADMMGKMPSSAEIIALLKHPLAHAEGKRKRHWTCTGILEKAFRRAVAEAPSSVIVNFREHKKARRWAAWLESWLDDLANARDDDLSKLVELHRNLAERLVAGSSRRRTDILWGRDEAGRTALEIMDELLAVSDQGGKYSPPDYASLFRNLAITSFVYEPYKTHPSIRIWNTLDARMQRPDVTVAGGLNESVWPAAIPQDPWLNRQMRKVANLRMPERAVGLSAHDFQQVVAGSEVLLSRSVRTVDAPTLPSRWICRLTSLLEGLDGDGQAALKSMRERGQCWIDLASKLEAPAPTERAKRPSPKPPAAARPSRLHVTEIKTLISDPYAIYAKHVLKLRPLDPFNEGASPAAKGTLVHKIFEKFIQDNKGALDESAAGKLVTAAKAVLKEAEIPRYAASFWLAEIGNIADQFIKSEIERQKSWTPEHFEASGIFAFPDLRVGSGNFEINGRADRIDVDSKGNWALYDYKTGAVPSKSDVVKLDKQMPLLAIMIEKGAFEGISGGKVLQSSYLGVGNKFGVIHVQREDAEGADLFSKDWESFQDLVKSYLDPAQGFTSRRDMKRLRYSSDYDHLARYGEWDETSSADEEETMQ